MYTDGVTDADKVCAVCLKPVEEYVMKCEECTTLFHEECWVDIAWDGRCVDCHGGEIPRTKLIRVLYFPRNGLITAQYDHPFKIKQVHRSDVPSEMLDAHIGDSCHNCKENIDRHFIFCNSCNTVYHPQCWFNLKDPLFCATCNFQGDVPPEIEYRTETRISWYNGYVEKLN